MVSKVQAGTTVLARMAVYRLFARLAPLRRSLAAKFAAAAFVGVFLPIAVFAAWLAVRSGPIGAYSALVILVFAGIGGFLALLWMIRELLVPVELTARALREYIDRRRLPDLPEGFPDAAGALMEGTQYTLRQLDEAIHRLEGVSDTDDLTGLYTRRAGEKRLAEEVARAERDLQGFQLALLDIDRIEAVNARHGRSAVDACIAHVAAVLQSNVRQGDWLARRDGGEFVVGLHRNQALKSVVGRLVEAVEASPCEIAPGVEVTVRLACGVAEYRFGEGSAGLLADAGHAVYAAKALAQADGASHTCYRSELDMPRPAPRAEEPVTG
jgi:diguanylate cyclase (GGDEF)-like protein